MVGPQLGLREATDAGVSASKVRPVRVYCCPLRETSSAPDAAAADGGERQTSPVPDPSGPLMRDALTA